MIRRPSSYQRLYEWHALAVAGKAPAMHDGLPECGFYKRRMIKGGPWVPVRIFVKRDIDPETGDLTGPESLCCEIEGVDGGDPADIWTYLTPITRREFDHLMDYRLRDTRMLDPNRRLDLSDKPTPPQGVF